MGELIFNWFKQSWQNGFTKNSILNSSSLVLVTGGSGGLGLQIALQLAILRIKVIIVDIVSPSFLQLPNEYITFYQCDITDLNAVIALRTKINSKLGKVTVLINNAGIVSISPLQKTSDDVIDKVIRVNLFGTYIMTQTFLPDISLATSGAVVNISSILGVITPARLCPYGSSKAGMIVLHEAMKTDLNRQSPVTATKSDLKAILVCCGKIKTPMFKHVSTPSAIIAPDIDPSRLASCVISALVTNGPDVIMKPYYTNLIPFFKRLEWPYIKLLKRCSGMDEATRI